MDKALLVCTSCTAAGAHSLYLHKKKRKRKKKKKQWSHMTTTLSQNLRICEEGLRKLGCKEKNRNQTNKQSKSVSNKRPHVDSYRIYFRFSGRKEDRPIRFLDSYERYIIQGVSSWSVGGPSSWVNLVLSLTQLTSNAMPKSTGFS
ncbi:unnamed protein product [Sphagnum jensenii]|uniref:LAGLIDADG homing endonuclease n=1 Tax=Sphagnum jensenii TaxID=128206 RepID=A0ABP0VT92_9BRYO